MTSPDALAPLLWWLLAGVVFPAWLLSGLADYVLHARMDIAHTSGVHESALHLLQTAEIGVPLLAFLFFQVNAGILLLLFAGMLLHTATSWRDVRYAATLRPIPTAEQFAHSALNVLPWVSFAIIVVLHWPVVQGLIDGPTRSQWRPHPRDPGFDTAVVVAVLASSALLGVLPGLLEFLRTLAVRRRGDQSSSNSARSATNPR